MNKKKEYTIEIEGGRVTGTIPRLSSFFGVDYEIVKQRIRRGWTVEQALGIMPPPERKIIHVPIGAAEKIQRETVERKVPRRKERDVVFYRCTSAGGYYDYARKKG